MCNVLYSDRFWLTFQCAAREKGDAAARIRLTLLNTHLSLDTRHDDNDDQDHDHGLNYDHDTAPTALHIRLTLLNTHLSLDTLLGHFRERKVNLKITLLN